MFTPSRVAVGSDNPAKRRAVGTALPDATVESIRVESGVSEQPRGHDETRRGAKIRARRAFGAGEFDCGVGLEGGVAAFGCDEDESTADLFLIMWAAVTDERRTATGAGPSLPLPAAVAERIRAGEELGPVMDDTLDEEDLARRAGAAGAFTGGRLTRSDALAAAVTAALGPFASDLYER